MLEQSTSALNHELIYGTMYDAVLVIQGTL